MAAPADDDFDALLRAARACTLCAASLPLGPRPVLRGRPSARLMIVSQAPGTKVHETGLSFNDRSGEVLRAWLGLDRATFYDEDRIAIIPMGLCYPGRAASGGDLPPRPECGPLWQSRLRAGFPALTLTILAGSYAIQWHLRGRTRRGMRQTVAAWRDYLPEFFPIPHPSWRNTFWVRNTPWFTAELLPELRRRVAEAIAPKC